jgi:hypothetical protein
MLVTGLLESIQYQYCIYNLSTVSISILYSICYLVPVRVHIWKLKF